MPGRYPCGGRAGRVRPACETPRKSARGEQRPCGVMDRVRTLVRMTAVEVAVVGERHRWLARVEALDASIAGLVDLRVALAELGRLRSFLEGRAAVFARRLAEVSSTPERLLAGA